VLSYMVVLGILLIGGEAAGLSHEEGQTAEVETWGNPFRGLSVAVKPSKPRYNLGEQIDILVRFRNVAQEQVTLRTESYLVPYRVALFYTDGQPVPKTTQAKEQEARIGKPPLGQGHISTADVHIKPGETALSFRLITLNPLFAVDTEGTYFVVVMHKLRSWNEGFAISNLAKFRVISPKKRKDSDAERSKAGPAKPH